MIMGFGRDIVALSAKMLRKKKKTIGERDIQYATKVYLPEHMYTKFLIWNGIRKVERVKWYSLLKNHLLWSDYNFQTL